MKNLFVIFAVATILFSCGQEKTTKCDTDSTKACCKDSTSVITDSASVITDSTTTGHDSTSVVSPKVEK